MEFSIIQASNHQTSLWSGGTTTQLFIYPLTASYQDRNFDFRLSTAKVEAEKSEFTSLPGVSRKIMILDGEINIQHESHYSKQLNKFDIDEFEGDWKTTSIGKCTDFNLMTKNKITGKLQAVAIRKNKDFDLMPDKSWSWMFAYVFSGKISFETKTLHQGDLLVFSKLINSNICFKAIENSELIFSKIAI